MLRPLLVLLVLLALGGCAGSSAPADASPGSAAGPVAQINRVMGQLQERLTLTPAQRDRVRPIVAAHLRRQRELLGQRTVTTRELITPRPSDPADRRRTRPRYRTRTATVNDRSRDEMRDELDALQRETDAQLRAVLEAEQFAEYELWRDEQREEAGLPPLDAPAESEDDTGG